LREGIRKGEGKVRHDGCPGGYADFTSIGIPMGMRVVCGARDVGRESFIMIVTGIF
jgi:hypothetical protein